MEPDERDGRWARDALAALRADGRVLAVLVVVGVALPLLAAAGLLELAVRALVAACTVLVALALWQAEHGEPWRLVAVALPPVLVVVAAGAAALGEWRADRRAQARRE